MLSKPKNQNFSQSADLENGKIIVRPEFSISHKTEIKEAWIESKIEDWLGISNSNPEVLYMPGTFNEEFGGYFHTTMPVIFNGEILKKRRKIKSHYEVNDWFEVARKLEMKDESCLISEAERTLRSPSESYMTSYNASEIDSVLYKDPKNAVLNKLQEVATEEALNTVDTIDFNGYEILPIICNEISQIELDEAIEPDIIVEASYDLPNWEEDYLELSDRNNINSTYILRADGAHPVESGTYRLQSGYISDTDLSTKVV